MRCDHCYRTVHPVVALDIDGTMADYHGHFIEFLGNYLRISEDRWWQYDGSCELSDWLELDKRTYQDAKLAFRSGGFKRWMPAFEGLPDLINTAETFGCAIWVTTTRPWMRLDNIDPDTREWLTRNGIKPEGLLFHEDKYQRLTEAVDKSSIVLVLEDQPDQYDRAKSLGLPVRLRATNWNEAIWPGRDRVYDLKGAALVLEHSVREWRSK